MKSFARNRKNRRPDGIDPDTTEPLLDVHELDIAPLGFASDALAAAVPEDPNANEAADFSARLGDLDRFIGGNNSGGISAPSAPVSWTGGAPARNLPAAPIPAVAPISHARPIPVDRAPEPATEGERPVADPDAEAQEFMDRLSDLDRFIGGNSIGGSPQPPER